MITSQYLLNLLELFLAFFKIGCFSFGGAYAAIPLIREEVLVRGWMTQEALANFIAVSESTPGPVMVNLATFVGSTKGGLPGSVIATLGVVLPAFIIIVAMMTFLQGFTSRPAVRAVLAGIKACVVGVILATGISMIVQNLAGDGTDVRAMIITALLIGLRLGYRKFKKKPLPAIPLIGAAAVLGMIVYGI